MKVSCYVSASLVFVVLFGGWSINIWSNKNVCACVWFFSSSCFFLNTTNTPSTVKSIKTPSNCPLYIVLKLYCNPIWCETMWRYYAIIIYFFVPFRSFGCLFWLSALSRPFAICSHNFVQTHRFANGNVSPLSTNGTFSGRSKGSKTQLLHWTFDAVDGRREEVLFKRSTHKFTR